MSEPTRLKFGEGFPEPINWKTMSEGKAKYQAYLCSREWAEKKRAIMERCDGVCERCGINDADAVHHLSYLHKYQEQLNELTAICKACHDFTHGHSGVDPVEEIHKALVQTRPLSLSLSDPGVLGDLLICPDGKCCGGMNVHINGARHVDSDCVIIDMKCEGRHRWEVVFQFDQGSMMVFTRNFHEAEFDD